MGCLKCPPEGRLAGPYPRWDCAPFPPSGKLGGGGPGEQAVCPWASLGVTSARGTSALLSLCLWAPPPAGMAEPAT